MHSEERKMSSRWKKLKLALGLKAGLHTPSSSKDVPSPSIGIVASRFSDADTISFPDRLSDHLLDLRTSPIPSSSGLRRPKSHSRSSKGTCAICLNTMKPGHGHAIFTAECSHAFHFHCIASNVKHGNQVCPVCRAKWKEVPFQGPDSEHSLGRARANPGRLPQDGWMTLLQQMPRRSNTHRNMPSLFHAPEPSVFDDDESLPDTNKKSEVKDGSSIGRMEVRTVPEVSAIPRSAAHSNFTVLIHLKAPAADRKQDVSTDQADPSTAPRAPVDLVTVLDISGSMAGTKLALLKRAMGFVIHNVGPSDRLSIVAFSSTAHRLFPLMRMTDSGRQKALLAVNSLISNGGTNIAEGLRKAAKVMADRRWKNPVGSVMLLSDGQDTYALTGPRGTEGRDYQSLLPSHLQIPVHAFGFGADHDSALMHSISESSSGTFSFIEAENVIQDAFAQCIGGLLSVVVQQLQVEVSCHEPGLKLASVKAGSYLTTTSANARTAFIEAGDLYAEEERDFLVTLDLPVHVSGDGEMKLLKVRCVYRDPITKRTLSMEVADGLRISRPERVEQPTVSMEVDRQRNRLRAAEAIAEARASAENDDLAAAVSILESCRTALSESVSSLFGDRLCGALCAELKEMQERMANRRVYEASGRAYVLSGLSSHSWQRATARGDSTDSTSLVQAYQTPSMVDMVTRSQTLVLGNMSSQSTVRAPRSLPFQLQPR